VAIQTERSAVTLNVQIAATEETRRAGLMNRTSLAPDSGMAFLFPRPTDQSFWMKDTPIPLSIAFWGTDGRIASMLEMTPCRADPCPTYFPGNAYVGAVEANRGFFVAHGVEVGDVVALTR